MALARSPSDVEPTRHWRLHKFTLDFSRGAEGLSPLLRGCDMAISCLGNRRGEQKMVYSATNVILTAMVAAGVPRMVMISCVGIGNSHSQLCAMHRASLTDSHPKSLSIPWSRCFCQLDSFPLLSSEPRQGLR